MQPARLLLTMLRTIVNKFTSLSLIFFILIMAACSRNKLSSWNGGYPTLQPFNNVQKWLVLKCAFSDDSSSRSVPADLNPAIPNLDAFINDFLTLGGVGTGNVIDYYREITYGSLSLQTRVFGWYNAPYASTNKLSRTQRIEQCASTAPDSDGIDFSTYDGIVIVTNKGQDGGAAGVGKIPLNIKGSTYQMGAVVFDSSSLFTAFAAHEMGHGFGLQHSFDTTSNKCGQAGAGEYCDPFDIMSALITQQFSSPNYPPEGLGLSNGPGSGPGMNLPNLLQLNAVPIFHLANYAVGDPLQTIQINALSMAQPGSLLGIKIFNPANPNDIFTVEYRQTTGWDTGLAGNVVLIHEYLIGSSPYSILQRGPISGGWGKGGLYVNRDKRIIISVKNVDSASGTATINVNSFSN
jgi:hypothetical protein